MDYQGNANKDKTGKGKPEKKVEQIVTGKVITKKKPLGQKIKDLFIEADFKSVARYVMTDVLLPAARNMIYDGATEGIKRMMYGASAGRRIGVGSRVTYTPYNNPIHHRGFRETIGAARNAPALERGPRSSRSSREDFIISSKEEAEAVLERMNDIIDQYEVVSVADLNSLVGEPSSYVDEKWGWDFLGDVPIHQTRDGWLINFPPPQPIQ